MPFTRPWTATAAAALLCGGTFSCSPSPRPDQDLDRYFEALPDPTGANVQVTVDIFEVDENERFALDVAWRYAAERGESVSVPAACRRNGVRVGEGTPSLAAEVRAAAERARSSRRSRLFQTVLDGHTGLFQISEVQMTPVTMVVWDERLEQRTVALTRPQAGLEVRPERMGSDRIRLDVTPVVTSVDGGAAMTLTQMRARVVVPRGVPVVLGGLDQEQESFGSAFFSTRSARGRRRRLLLVSAR